MKKHTGQIIIAPRITEKGAYLSEKGVYVFDVEKDASKHDIAEAIRTVFKVTPRMVRTVTLRGKVRSTRGTNRAGRTTGGKKAYVYLKAGDTIELI